MAVLPSHKNALVLLREFKNNLTRSTGITNFDFDSKSRSIIDALTEESLQARRDSVSAFESLQISTATGRDLDQLGISIGLERLQPTFAVSTSVENNIMFFTASINFGAINGGLDITIPAGTVIFSAPNNNELGATIQFKTTSETLLSSGDSVGYASVKAVSSGSGSNVGAAVLQQHNFGSYVDAANNTLKVINTYPILTGRDPETDQQYRYRLTTYYSSLLQTNEAKIRLTALQVPGVVDIKLIPGYFGIGTAGVLVLGAENQSTPSLVRDVQYKLVQLKAPGLQVEASAAVEVSFDFELRVKASRSLTDAEQRRVKSDIRRVILIYMSAVSIGGTLDFDLIARQIQLQTNNLLSLKLTRDQEFFFKAVYQRKGLANSSASERELLAQTRVSLNEDEFATLGTLDIVFAE